MDDDLYILEPHLTSLPSIALINIFKYCSIQDLGRVAQVCKLFRYILVLDDVWIYKSKSAIGSNMAHSVMKSRAQPYLFPKDRSKVSRFWVQKKVNPPCKTHTYSRCMPWLQITKHFLYLSYRIRILRFNRTPECASIEDIHYCRIPHKDDISKFAIRDGKGVSGGRDGTITYWHDFDEDDSVTFVAHTSDILGIDCQKNFAVSCSKDKTVKLFQMNENSSLLRATFDFDIRVLDVAFLFSPSLILCSTPGVSETQPLEMYDTVTCQKVTHFGDRNHIYGAGILCLYPESSQTFLSCGYDTTVRLWDVRIPKRHVSHWMDIYDNSIYCVTSDHNVTIVSGAGRSGLVHVWDKRSKLPVKMLHGKNSPVYSVTFDPCNLYSALDTQIHHYSFLNWKM